MAGNRVDDDRSEPRRSTLLALVQSLWDEMDSEQEVAAAALELVNEGRVILTGNFRGCRLEPANPIRVPRSTSSANSGCVRAQIVRGSVHDGR